MYTASYDQNIQSYFTNSSLPTKLYFKYRIRSEETFLMPQMSLPCFLQLSHSIVKGVPPPTFPEWWFHSQRQGTRWLCRGECTWVCSTFCIWWLTLPLQHHLWLQQLVAGNPIPKLEAGDSDRPSTGCSMPQCWICQYATIPGIVSETSLDSCLPYWDVELTSAGHNPLISKSQLLDWNLNLNMWSHWVCIYWGWGDCPR